MGGNIISRDFGKEFIKQLCDALSVEFDYGETLVINWNCRWMTSSGTDRPNSWVGRGFDQISDKLWEIQSEYGLILKIFVTIHEFRLNSSIPKEYECLIENADGFVALNDDVWRCLKMKFPKKKIICSKVPPTLPYASCVENQMFLSLAENYVKKNKNIRLDSSKSENGQPTFVVFNTIRPGHDLYEGIDELCKTINLHEQSKAIENYKKPKILLLGRVKNDDLFNKIKKIAKNLDVDLYHNEIESLDSILHVGKTQKESINKSFCAFSFDEIGPRSNSSSLVNIAASNIPVFNRKSEETIKDFVHRTFLLGYKIAKNPMNTFYARLLQRPMRDAFDYDSIVHNLIYDLLIE